MLREPSTRFKALRATWALDRHDMAAVDMLSRHAISTPTWNADRGLTDLTPWIVVHPLLEHDCVFAYSLGSCLRYGQANNLSGYNFSPAPFSALSMPPVGSMRMVEREDFQ
jgi:hypothetical protein